MGSPLVFCKAWLLTCAYFYALVESLVLDCSVIVVTFCCHVRREMRISHVMLQNAM